MPTREELAKTLRVGLLSRIGAGPCNWEHTLPAVQNDFRMIADAAFVALGVTPDPELPPGPWSLEWGRNAFGGENSDRPWIEAGNGVGFSLRQGWQGEAVMEELVRTWNRTNGYA